MLYGYDNIILEGTLLTLKLTCSSLLLAVTFGLVFSSAKLSNNMFLRLIGSTYTTLIRSIPDLVLMLLVYYNLQALFNQFTDAFSLQQIDISPLLAGIITLGFIYGAYFTETFRGAFLSVPKGQIEAAHAYGLSAKEVFYHVTLPQMLHFALPGISNNLQVVIKATALVSIIGLQDIIKSTQIAGAATMHVLYFSLIAGLIYLIITSFANFFLNILKQRFSRGIKVNQL